MTLHQETNDKCTLTNRPATGVDCMLQLCDINNDRKLY